MKLSNLFTCIRAFFAPIFLLIYLIPSVNYLNNPTLLKVSGFVMLPLLAIIEFTDFLDGYFARKRNEVSDFGKIFDPFADVILHITTLAIFTFEGKFHIIFFLLILYREFTMNFLRMVAMKKGVAIAARKGGKLKTCLYILTGFVMLFVESLARVGVTLDAQTLVVFDWVIFFLSWACVIASYISFFDYVKHFAKVFKEQ